MDKKPVLIFSAADINHFDYAVGMFNSLTKFHHKPEVDIIFFTNETNKEKLDKLPKDVEVRDLTPYLEDPMFWYRQKPVLAEQFMDEYALVLGLDVDQFILGDLSYIFNTKDYDVGTVINWNRYDITHYPQVDLLRIGISPVEYFNCGLVAMRNKQFVHNWKVNCFGPQFDRVQYKEQDILNVMCYYGNWNIRCFDHTDGPAKMHSWWGPISKGELIRAEYKDGDIVVPQGLGSTPFPPIDMTIKAFHPAGGDIPNKMHYKTWFKDEKIIEKIDWLISPTK